MPRKPPPYQAGTDALLERVAGNLLENAIRRGGVDRTAQSGTGLGLSIVRAVVSAHGGQLYAEPVSGGGVTARLPVAP